VTIRSSSSHRRLVFFHATPQQHDDADSALNPQITTQDFRKEITLPLAYRSQRKSQVFLSHRDIRDFFVTMCKKSLFQWIADQKDGSGAGGSSEI